MKATLITKIKRLFYVEYRLTVFYTGVGRPWNTYGRNGRLLKAMTKSLAKNDSWSLYKRGPIGLPERAIASSQWSEKGGER